MKDVQSKCVPKLFVVEASLFQQRLQVAAQMLSNERLEMAQGK